jgi:hypothetical protein
MSGGRLCHGVSTSGHRQRTGPPTDRNRSRAEYSDRGRATVALKSPTKVGQGLAVPVLSEPPLTDSQLCQPRNLNDPNGLSQPTSRWANQRLTRSAILPLGYLDTRCAEPMPISRVDIFVGDEVSRCEITIPPRDSPRPLNPTTGGFPRIQSGAVLKPAGGHVLRSIGQLLELLIWSQTRTNKTCSAILFQLRAAFCLMVI